MSFLSKFSKLLLSIRYDIKITWLENMEKDKSHLILPSHVALMDPVIMFTYLSEKGKINPVMTESYFKIPVLKSFFKSIWAVSVPDLEKDSNKNLDTKELMKSVKESLEKWNNILLYPQWALARQWFQSIIGKKSAFFAVEELPENSKILTVNIRWLRGSRSGRSRTWHSPNLFSFLLKGLWFTLANLFFFVPKRTIEIEISDATTNLKKVAKKGLDSFNQELEKIYNAKWEEELRYISGLCRYNTVKNHQEPKVIIGSIADLKKWSFDWKTDIPDEILSKITNIIKEIKPDYNKKIDLNTNLILDCLFDSLDMANVKTRVQSEFSNSSNPPLMDLKTVGDLAMMALGKSNTTEELKPCEWKISEDEELIHDYIKPLISDKSTILSVMKDAFKNSKSDTFCYDQLFWVQTKKDFLIKAYLIADILKKLPGEKIAIMLPALSATTLLVTWCYLANKVPVMLNWTQSEEAFAHCLNSQKVKTILTAKSFFQKIQTSWLQKYEMTYFEELLKNVSLWKKVKAVFNSIMFKIPTNISKVAVILFTSWSESLPKTVELTHQNILHDLLGALWNVGARKDSVEIWFLPPFHSFGFALWLALPLISGMRIVYTPDPNDGTSIAKLINHTKSTLLAATPTFLRRIIQSAKDNQLNSLLISIVWAEKCPDEVFKELWKKAKNAEIIEWYGITECSPVIAVNPIKKWAKIKKWTVWLPIVWEDVRIISIESWEDCKTWKEWMIYVHGKNVFGWYIDKKLESPFIEMDGKQWYKTGDLWFFDKDWYLTISWRLKRFVKIAGEMISLPSIESVLSRKYKSESGLENIAIEATENPDWTATFTLFTTEYLEVSEVNSYLHQEWISNLINISKIQKLEEIPLLWTGKVDHVSLKKLLEE